MLCGKKAEQNLIKKAKKTIVLATFDRWICNDFRLSSIVSEALGIGKYVLQNDKQTQKEVGIVIGCKLRSYL